MCNLSVLCVPVFLEHKVHQGYTKNTKRKLFNGKHKPLIELLCLKSSGHPVRKKIGVIFAIGYVFDSFGETFLLYEKKLFAGAHSLRLCALLPDYVCAD